MGIAPKSICRFKSRIRQLTRRNRPGTLSEKIIRLNLFITGWIAYFRYSRSRSVLEELDHWIRRKLRVIRLKQLKRPYTITQFLQGQGVPEWSSWILALSGKGYWRMSRCPQAHQAMNLRWFKELGLVSLTNGWEVLRTTVP